MIFYISDIHFNDQRVFDKCSRPFKNLEEYKLALEKEDKEALFEAIRRGRLLKERDININGAEKPHKFG